MAALGPEFGGAAGDVADALQELAEHDPDAFDGDEVIVDVDGESYTVDTDVANFAVEEQTETGEHITPHVVEPSFGVGRTVYTLLEHAYSEDEVDDETRTYLSLAPEIAPTDVAVFPLVSNDEALIDVASDLADELRAAGISVSYDDSGSIGRRYRRQDEVGTPFCVTVDQDGLEGDDETTVTLRERDSAAQLRLPVADLAAELEAIFDGDRAFADLQDRYDRVDTDVTTD
jgi:glycyl-tRNA synthetase